MAARRTFEVKSKQRQKLEEYRDHDGRPYMRERCGALLKIAGGQTPHATAQSVMCYLADRRTGYSSRHGSW